MEETTKQLLTTIAENQPKIKELGYSEGFEAGKQKEWSDFWDNYIKRIEVNSEANYAFAGSGWTDETFLPNRDIVPKGDASSMFRGCCVTDLETTMLNRGLNLDVSQCTHFGYGFYNSEFKSIPFDLDFRSLLDNNASVLVSAFVSASKLVTIKKIILSESGNQIFNNTFTTGNSKLQNITFEGVIGQNISFSYCPLSVESMKSVITHLKNYAGINEYTYTVTFNTSAFEALEASGEKSPNGNTWAEYIDDLKWNLVKA